MSYATKAQFKSWFAGQGTRAARFMQETDPTIQDVRFQEALDAASAAMDANFRAAGYSVPIDPAAAGAETTALTALLERLCISLTEDQILSLGGPPLIQDGFHQGKTWAQQFLSDIKGRAGFDSYGAFHTSMNPAAILPGLQRGDGPALTPYSASSSTLEQQTAHGFALGSLLRRTSTAWALAKADAIGHAALAIVFDVPDADDFWAAYLSAGVAVYLPAHGLGANGAQLYLSQATAGLATSTRPATGMTQRVGVVKDSNTIVLQDDIEVAA